VIEDLEIMKLKLTEQQRRSIAEAIGEAEARTSGEIVTVVLPQSDDYPAARWRLAVVTSLLAAFLLYFFSLALDPFWVLCIQFPALGLGYFLGGTSFFKRLMTTDAEIEEEFEQRAIQAFHAQKLAMTRDRTGILIFLSMLEHRVKIMADIGIAAKVPPEVWNQIVATLIQDIREHHFSEGLIKAIHRCGDCLAHHFPSNGEDLNELSDDLITE
jgi:putative membrane protein